jgi:ketosteroid isomerase-like protein
MQTDMRTDVDRLEDILRRIEVAEHSGNAGAIIDLLAEDAVIMAPNQPVQEGKGACAAFLTGVMRGWMNERRPR